MKSLLLFSILFFSVQSFCQSEDFFKAVKDGDLSAVSQHIKEDQSLVNAVDGSGYSALLWAVENGRVEVVRLLLENGANPNGTMPFSVWAWWHPEIFEESRVIFRPLERAGELQQTETIRLLLLSGAQFRNPINWRRLENVMKEPIFRFLARNLRQLERYYDNEAYREVLRHRGRPGNEFNCLLNLPIELLGPENIGAHFNDAIWNPDWEFLISHFPEVIDNLSLRLRVEMEDTIANLERHIEYRREERERILRVAVSPLISMMAPAFFVTYRHQR